MQNFIISLAIRFADWIYEKSGDCLTKQLDALDACLGEQVEQVVSNVQLPKFQNCQQIYVKFHIPALANQPQRDRLVRKAGAVARKRIFDELDRDVKVFAGYDSRTATVCKSNAHIKACRWVG